MIRVVNKHKHKPTPDDIYIGRGSALGNIFKIGEHGSREEVIAQYREYLRRRIACRHPDILRAFKEIMDRERSGKNTNLVCFCAPQACHGDLIAGLVDFGLSNQSPDEATIFRLFGY